jgi:hypothetical protein
MISVEIFKLSRQELLSGVVAAITWGTILGFLKNFFSKFPFAIVFMNILAFFTAWYSQQVIINIFERTDAFKDEAKKTEFINTRGYEILKELDRNSYIR